MLGLTFKEPEEAPIDSEQLGKIKSSVIAKLRREKLEYVLEKVANNPDSESVDGYLNLLRELRNALRKDKKFELADEIRSKLDEIGITLEDKPTGTVWRRKRS